jgi:AcrR family transcriptional regulator
MEHTYHHGDLRQAILDATLDIIDNDGLDAVSLRAVARGLGVSEAAPYHHFTGKQDLLAVLVTDAYGAFGQRLTEAMTAAGPDAWEQLRALVLAYVRYGLESRGRYRLMFGEHMIKFASNPDVVAAARPTRLVLEEAVAACLGPKRTDSVALENTVWALAHGITSLVGEAEIPTGSDPDSIDRLGEVAAAVLIGGIRAYVQAA